MSTQTVCDQCGKVLSPHLSSYRLSWSNDADHPARDYCSTRCAVMALGGEWRATTLSAEWLNIPWPPSDELVERVAGAIGQYAPQRDPDEHELLTKIARAVLDAIGGEA